MSNGDGFTQKELLVELQRNVTKIDEKVDMLGLAVAEMRGRMQAEHRSEDMAHGNRSQWIWIWGMILSSVLAVAAICVTVFA